MGCAKAAPVKATPVQRATASPAVIVAVLMVMTDCFHASRAVGYWTRAPVSTWDERAAFPKVQFAIDANRVKSVVNRWSILHMQSGYVRIWSDVETSKDRLLSRLSWATPLVAGVAIVAVTWFVIHTPF